MHPLLQGQVIDESVFEEVAGWLRKGNWIIRHGANYFDIYHDFTPIHGISRRQTFAFGSDWELLQKLFLLEGYRHVEDTPIWRRLGSSK